jgi:hypothetical protein
VARLEYFVIFIMKMGVKARDEAVFHRRGTARAG